MRLTIHAIDCKVHSAGVDADVLNSLSTAVSAAAAVGKASAPFLGPVGTAVSAALQAAGALVEGVVNLVIAIDRAGDDPDQLYLNLSNDERLHKIWPADQPYYNIRSGQITRPALVIPFSSALDINFWEYDTGSDDDFLGRLSVDATHQGGVRYQVVARPSEGAVYTVAYTVDEVPSSSVSAGLFWYKHNNWQSGVASITGPQRVGDNWANFKSVFATGNGVIYGIQNDGNLLWYRHVDYQSGLPSLRGAVDVGNGWANPKTVFATSNGVVYGIHSNGKLIWYKHNGWLNGTPTWAANNGKEIGTGWANFKSVFATSDGIIYGIQNDGKLLWYRHNDYLNGAANLTGPIQVGTGWANFKTVFATRNGIIYAVQPDGALLWYYHQGWQTGAATWAGPVRVGSGWQGFKSVFATDNGIIYGINP